MMGFRRRKTEYRAARVQEDGKRTSCGRLLISYVKNDKNGLFREV
jgi:hypothetical protein